jgi:hypothetical protein
VDCRCPRCASRELAVLAGRDSAALTARTTNTGPRPVPEGNGAGALS